MYLLMIAFFLSPPFIDSVLSTSKCFIEMLLVNHLALLLSMFIKTYSR